MLIGIYLRKPFPAFSNGKPCSFVYIASLQISLIEMDFNRTKTDQCQRPVPHVHRAGWAQLAGRGRSQAQPFLSKGAILTWSVGTSETVPTRMGWKRPFPMPTANSAYFPGAAQS